MAYTSPRTWVAGEVLTAALMNTHLRDNLLALATTGGLLKHEAGGIEADISAVVKGGIPTGTGSGTMALLVVGGNDHFLVADSAESNGMKWSAGGAVSRVGGNTTEATTTSTSAVDLMTVVTGVSIAATTPFILMAGARKTTGAADNAATGLKLNTTVTMEASTADGIWRTADSLNEAKSGGFQVTILPRVTSYLQGGFTGYNVETSGAGGGAAPAKTLAFPSAAITDVIIRAIVGNALMTAGVDEGHVFVYPTS